MLLLIVSKQKRTFRNDTTWPFSNSQGTIFTIPQTLLLISLTVYLYMNAMLYVNKKYAQLDFNWHVAYYLFIKNPYNDIQR